VLFHWQIYLEVPVSVGRLVLHMIALHCKFASSPLSTEVCYDHSTLCGNQHAVTHFNFTGTIILRSFGLICH